MNSFYVTSFCTVIERLLRRTLIRLVMLLSFVEPEEMKRNKANRSLYPSSFEPLCHFGSILFPLFGTFGAAGDIIVDFLSRCGSFGAELQTQSFSILENLTPNS
jgi:hypothetical protein